MANDQLPTVQPARTYITTESNNPVMDTAQFEHMGRIAKQMALGGMMHKTLITTGTKGNEQYLPPEVVAARAFMIVEQAARWGQSPFAIMQGASFVHGRLMWEGKLVASILTDVFNIELDYHFGTWDAKSGHVILPGTDEREPGESDTLGVIVCERGADPLKSRRTVEGSVGQWKTTGAGSPWQPGAIKRQMRYRGAREWARAFRSGAILGIVTNDERIEDAVIDEPKATGKGRLSQQLATPVVEQGTGGFDARNFDKDVGSDPKPEPEAEKAADETAPEADQKADEKAEKARADQAKKDEIAEQRRQIEEKAAEAAKAKESAAEQAKPQEQPKAEEPEPEPVAERSVPDVQPVPMRSYIEQMKAATDWNGIKLIVGSMNKDDDYKALDREDKIRVHAAVWDCAYSVSPGSELQNEDPTACRFWMDSVTDKAAIVAAVRTLEHSQKFMAMKDVQKENFHAIMNERLAELGAE